MQPCLDDAELGGVDHDGQPGDIGFGHNEVQEVGHGLFGVEQAFIHIDVDDLGAALHLMLSYREGFGIIARFDKAGEFAGAGDIGSFPDVDEVGFRADDQGLQSAEHSVARLPGDAARRQSFDSFGHQADVVRRGAAAAPDEIDEAAGSKVADVVAHLRGALVIFAELVGQAGVGVGGDITVGDIGQGLQVGAHFFGAQRTVEPYTEQGHVTNGNPESFGGLS